MKTIILKISTKTLLHLYSWFFPKFNLVSSWAQISMKKLTKTTGIDLNTKLGFLLKRFLIEVDTALQSSPYKVSNFMGYSQSIWTPKHDLRQTHELESPQLVLVLDAYRCALMESVKKQAKKINTDLVITAGITNTSFFFIMLR